MQWLVPEIPLVNIATKLSCGLQFYASYKHETEVTPAKNTLLKMRTKQSTRELLLEMRYKSQELVVPSNTTILALEKGSPLEFEDLNIYESASAETDPSNTISHPLEGYWSMVCFDSDNDLFPALGLFHFILSVAPDGSITGSGEAYVGKLQLTGTTALSTEGSSVYALELKMVIDSVAMDHGEPDYVFHGTHNPERDVVAGSWESVDRPSETPPEASAQQIAGAAQEGGTSEAAQDSEVGQSFLAPSNGTTEPVSANTPPEAETHADTVVQDTQTLNASDGVVSDEQQAHSNDTSRNGHSDTGADQDNDRPQLQATNDEAKGSDNTTPADNDNSSTLGRAQDPQAQTQTTDDVAENGEEVNVSHAKEEVSPPALNTFSMRRTPADMRRFRRSLNLDTEIDLSVLAKNRWKFAIEATKFRVQLKNLSWEYVRARFSERRLWLNLTVAFWQDVLPQARIDLMCALTGECAPWQSRLYEAIAHYLNPREYLFKMYALVSRVQV